MLRKIIHIDMDAFYASVEQRDKPELKGKPIAVGSAEERGVVTTASYEARKYGVRSAMPSVVAARLCPNLIFVSPRFDVYKKVSEQIREIFYEYTDLVEPLSLDEAFLDVTQNKKGIPSATLLAREIKEKIKNKTMLTASAGISVNKFLAKIASDMNKPDGMFLIPPEKAVEFVERLPIEKIFGIGKVTARKMHEMGIATGLDLKKYTQSDLVKHFGKMGIYFFKIARAEDPREVNPHRIRKSLGAERTFKKDLIDKDTVKKELDKIRNELEKRIELSGTLGKTLTLKIKYSDFQQITRSKTLPVWIEKGRDMEIICNEFLDNIVIRAGIRLLGLTLSHLKTDSAEPPQTSDDHQLTLKF